MPAHIANSVLRLNATRSSYVCVWCMSASRPFFVILAYFVAMTVSRITMKKMGMPTSSSKSAHLHCGEFSQDEVMGVDDGENDALMLAIFAAVPAAAAVAAVSAAYAITTNRTVDHNTSAKMECSMSHVNTVNMFGLSVQRNPCTFANPTPHTGMTTMRDRGPVK